MTTVVATASVSILAALLAAGYWTRNKDGAALREGFRQTMAKVDAAEIFAVSLVTKLTTWIAPLIPAVLIYDAAMHRLGVGQPTAILIAAVTELLGIAVVVNRLEAEELARSSPDADHKMMPYNLMIAAYVATSLTIIVGLKVLDGMRWAAIIMLSLYGLLSAIAYMQRKQTGHKADELRHMAEIDAELIAQRRELDRRRAKMQGEMELEMMLLEFERDKARLQAELDAMRRELALQSAGPPALTDSAPVEATEARHDLQRAEGVQTTAEPAHVAQSGSVASRDDAVRRIADALPQDIENKSEVARHWQNQLGVSYRTAMRYVDAAIDLKSGFVMEGAD